MKTGWACVAAIATSAALSPSLGHSAEWTYSTKTDTFEAVEQQLANLAGDGTYWITISYDSRGQRQTLISSAQAFDCYPECSVRVKFDDAPPMSFTAVANKVRSGTILLKDHVRFEKQASNSTRIAVRAPRFRATNDLTFTASAGFSPDGWAALKRRQSRTEECQTAPTAIDFSACMAKP